jgi:hypothetical protein
LISEVSCFLEPPYLRCNCEFFLAGSSGLFSQYTLTPCFSEAKSHRIISLKRFGLEKRFTPNLDSVTKNVTASDIDSILKVNKTTGEMLVGCEYPDSKLQTDDGREFFIYDIKSEFTIINFNNVYCQACLKHLDDLAKIKKEKKATVLVFFPHSKSDVQFFTAKYKGILEIILSSWDYIDTYDLGINASRIFVLDKNKVIKYVTAGAPDEEGALHKMLAGYLK